jgi:DNA-binding transcriptional LysR family regulator
MSARPDLPDWNDLRDVLLVHEAGSLSAAARATGVSQSTMSRRLAAIEAGGLKVFMRDARGRTALTDRGAAMVAAARAMRQAFDQAAAALGWQDAPIRIAACEVTAQVFLADALPGWGGTGRPPADLAIYEDLFALSPKDYDILVTPAESAPHGAEALEIGRLELGVFAAPAYLASRPVRAGANSLSGHRVIGSSGSLAGLEMYRWFGALGGTPALISSSPLAQLSACARGLGVALLPRALADEDPRLQEIPMPLPDPARVWLLADAREASHPRVATFLRWARGRFRPR